MPRGASTDTFPMVASADRGKTFLAHDSLRHQTTAAATGSA
jgi:hypothetical protein